MVDIGVISARSATAAPTIRDQRDASRAAGELRRDLGLGQGPLGPLADVCADAGLFIVVLAGSDGGASMLVDGGLGAAVIGGSADPGRRRMTAAHELGHHVLQDVHQADVGVASRRQEREGLIEALAAEFLLPEEGLRAAWAGGSGDVRARLIQIAAAFRVSWTVAVRAAGAAGLTGGQTERSLLAASPGRADFIAVVGFEPAPDLLPGETGARWRRAVVVARSSGLITDARVVELLHGALSARDLAQLEPVGP